MFECKLNANWTWTEHVQRVLTSLVQHSRYSVNQTELNVGNSSTYIFWFCQHVRKPYLTTDNTNLGIFQSFPCYRHHCISPLITTNHVLLLCRRYHIWMWTFPNNQTTNGYTQHLLKQEVRHQQTTCIISTPMSSTSMLSRCCYNRGKGYV